MTWIDISMPLSAAMPVWPSSVGFSISRNREFAPGVTSVSSRLDTDVHCGTHIDAPAHFLPDGATIDAVPLDACIGPAVVVDVTGERKITAALLDTTVPPGTERLLLRTDNSLRWDRGDRDFNAGFSALSVDGAQWIADNDIRLVANDYLSIQLYQGDPETHRCLLRAGVVVVEGVLLGHVEPGEYELVCLPVRIAGAEGAPARALLRSPQ